MDFHSIVNCTPHMCNLILEDGRVIDFKPSGIIPRCTVSREKVLSLDSFTYSVPIFKSTFGEVEGAPEPVSGTLFIVSSLVAQATKRSDFIVPDDTVRDSEGKIVGCRGFAFI